MLSFFSARRIMKQLAKTSRRSAKQLRRSPRQHLNLESLESRDCPSTFTWTQTGAGTYLWSDPLNWDATGAPVATNVNLNGDDVVNFTATLAGNQVITVDGSDTIARINIGDPGGAFTYTLSSDGVAGDGLTFAVGGSTAQINKTSVGGGADAINAPMTLNANLTVTDSTANSLLLGGSITGSGGLTKGGTGTVTLGGQNAYLGATLVAQGTLQSVTVPIVPSGAIIHYSFDNVAGGVVPNLGTLGSANNASFQGTATVTTGSGGLQGEALSIPDQNGWLQTNLLGPNQGVGAFIGGGANTISAWFNNISIVGYRTLFRGSDASGQGTGDHQTIINNGGEKLGVYANSSYSGGGGFFDSGFDMTPLLTGWHQVTEVSTANQTQFYIDGAFVGTSNRQVGTDLFAIGNIEGGSQKFADKIDEVFAYQRALSPAEVTALHSIFIMNAIPDASPVTITTGATLDLNGTNEKIGTLAGGGNVTLGGGALTVNETAGTSFTGVISGSGGFTKAGSATLTMSGPNSYNGDTNIQAGALMLGANNVIPDGLTKGNVVIAGNAVLDLGGFSATINGLMGLGNLTCTTGTATLTVGNADATSTFNGNLSGTLSLTKTGAGILTLGGRDSYSGTTLVSQGTLQAANNVIPTGAAASYSFDNVTGNVVHNSGTLGSAYDAVLTGNAGISTGGGILGAAMTLPDNASMLLINQTNGIGVDLSGGNWTASSWFNGLYPSSQWRTLFRGTGSDHHVIVENGSYRLGSYVGGAGGFVPSGYDVSVGNVTTGWHQVTAVCSGGKTSMYIDGQFAGLENAETLFDIYAIGNIQYTGQAFAQKLDQVNIYQRALSPSDVFNLYGAYAANAIPDASPVTIAAGATLDLNGVNETIGPLTGTGNVTLGGGNLTVNSTSSSTFSGLISGAGGLIKSGSGTLSLGVANSYSGDTIIQSGTLQLAASNVIPGGATHGNVSIALGATLDMGGFSDTINGLSGAGLINNSVAGAPTITVGANDATSMFQGAIINAAGTLTLAKTGAGTLTLTGNDSYSGATNILQGTLLIANTPFGTAVNAAAYYSFDNAGGGVVPNLGTLGSANDATLQGSATITTDNSGFRGSQALSIPDQTGWLQTNQQAAAQGTGVFIGNPGGSAVSVWFDNISTAGYRTLFRGSDVTGQGTGDHQVIINAGGEELGVYANSVFSGGGGFRDTGYNMTPVLTGWHQVTAVASGGQTLFYIDGAFVGTSDRQFGTDVLSIGNIKSGGQKFADKIDEAYVFQRALSPAEVAGLYYNTGFNVIPDMSPVTVSPGATLNLNGIDETIGPLAGAGNVTLGAGTLTVNSATSSTFSGMISGSGGLVKNQSGTLILTNGGNSFSGTINVTAGILQVSASGAVGTGANALNVASGATLQLDGAFNFSSSRPLSLAGAGVGGVGALNKTNGSGMFSAPVTLLANTTIGSATAGSLFTMNSGINPTFFNLTVTGSGDTTINGSITPVIPTNSLANLNNLPTGDYPFVAAGQTFTAHVDNVGGVGWLLVGRGREGWSMTSAQQGAISAVDQHLGTSAAFVPAHYSDAIVNDLLAQSGLNNTADEVRLKRAAAIDGSSYQESRMGGFATSNFTWAFDSSIPDTWEVDTSALGGGFGPAPSNTFDTFQTGTPSGNDQTRLFTWAWSGHNNQQGFSYGISIVGTANNDPNTFLWMNTSEGHSIPYTEAYIRGVTTSTPVNNLTKNGSGTLTLTASDPYGGTTTVNNGRLNVDGMLTATSAVTVAGGTLGGSGTINAPVTATAGAVTPGDSPGILNTGNLALNSAASFNVILNGTAAGSGYSQDNVTGTVNLNADAGAGATLNVLSLGYTPTAGDQYVIINNDNTDAVSGQFAGLIPGSTVATLGGFNFIISYTGGDGNDVVLTAQSAATGTTVTGVVVNGIRSAPSGVDTLQNVVGQKSMVTDIEVTFGSVVTLGATAFNLTGVDPNGNPVSLASTGINVSTTTVGGVTVATLTFIQGSPGTAGGTGQISLADGRWNLHVVSAQVSGGLTGGDYASSQIKRLYGDINGDASVDTNDFTIFGPAFGSSVGDPNYIQALDFTNSHSIDSNTFTPFSTNFGVSV